MFVGARTAVLFGDYSEPSEYWGLAFTAGTANTTIGMTKFDTPPSITLEKSTDNGNTWTSFNPNGGSVTLAKVGDKVCFRAGASGNTGFYSPGAGGYEFTIISGSAAASGNIMSLLTQNESNWQSVTMADYCFSGMFWDCTGLTSAPDLPAMTLAESCYSDMFYGCASLTSAPALPATTLASGCYAGMFQDCTSLTSAPALPATTLAESCYSDMFYGCASLTSAPALPATTLESGCYAGMFQDCTSLTSAPALPATTLAYYCYEGMFSGCTSFASAPELPAMTLAEGCYYNMFYGCTSLTSAPALPATTLADFCYDGMFSGCTSLTAAPALPATTLASSCYYQMFQGCTSLNSVSIGFTSWLNGATTNWLEGVAASGTFTCPSALDTTTRDASHVPVGWTAEELPEYWGLTFTAGAANTRIGMAKTGTPPSVTLEKSTDGGITWTSFDPNGGSVTLANVGDEVCFRAGSSGNTRFASSDTVYYKFTIPAGSAAASGNIMSLLTQNESDWQSVTMADYCYKGMFSGCAGLTSAPALPATTLVYSCYNGMFSGCTGLASAPALPATTLVYKCYNGMFSGCTGLTSAPALTATTLASYCYSGMFSGCTGLTSAPALPATTLASYCYNEMFRGCTSLTSAPALSAMTLANSCCWGMFSGCTGLTSAPTLPATTLDSYCYAHMFYGCTSLTSAPALPATTLASSCYALMFTGCTSLTSAPALPATTLASSCYARMFQSCRSLTSAPALPATTLADGCYSYMFNYCTSLNSVTVRFTSWLRGATDGWLSNVAASGTFFCPNALNTTQHDSSHVPSGWTVERLAYWGLTFTAGAANTTIGMAKTGTPPSVTLEKSTDGGLTWTSFFDGNGDAIPVTLANVGDRVCFRAGSSGNAGFASGTNSYYGFTIPNGSAAASGNIMSLLTQNESGWQSVSMGIYCFGSLFIGCAGLTSAPALPATNLVAYCYFSMFWGCTSLASAPVLPAATLADNCYFNMFRGCTGLTSAPALPATTLAYSCYRGMFYGCTSLTSAPALPATTLATYCYSSMFWGCTSLASAPVLPAATLADNCYFCMFYDCTSLNSVTVEFTSWLSATTDWLNGVAASGTFICPSALDTTIRNSSHVPAGWTVSNPAFWGLTFTAESANTTIGMAKTGTPPSITLEKSTDNGSTWTSFSPDGGSVTLANVGDKVYFRAGASGNTRFAIDSYNYYRFTIPNGSAAASGNIMSLLTQNEGSWQSVTMGECCFSCLFYGCTTLTTAPALPATTLANVCYYNMFEGCASLTSAPALPATTLAYACYWSMFQGCTSLTSAPALPATALVDNCYCYMFEGCTSLTSAPALPATTLAGSCYAAMFQNCTSLTAAPALPAATLTASCYASMFLNCIALTYAPALPATTLAYYCYDSMFKGCTALRSVSVGFTSWVSDATDNWLRDVASTGTFTCPPALDTTTRDASHVPSGWTVNHYWGLTFTAGAANTTIGMAKTGTPPSVTLEKSTDGGLTWTSFFDGNGDAIPVTLANVGDQVCFRAGSSGNTGFASSINDYYRFTVSEYGSAAASGNIMSLLTQNESSWQSTTMADYCFCRLFYGFSARLTSAPDLPATKLADYCYYYMFQDCTGLTSAPALPVTTLADYCYASMFYGCTSLTSTPTLPATTLADGCYCEMFQSCRGLTSASALPATTLADNCYDGMFIGCTSLTHAQQTLPATTLSLECYSSMFYGCTSLASAPALPATTLASKCYYYMFYGCTSLTSAPALPATTLVDQCYRYMFDGCTSLASVEVGFSSWVSGATNNWLRDVAASGTFGCPFDLPQTVGSSNIPSGWTITCPAGEPLYFEAKLDSGATINMEKGDRTDEYAPPTVTLEYLTDSSNGWQAFPPQGGVTIAQNKRVYVRAGQGGNTRFGGPVLSSSNYFTISASCEVGGNIMSLLDRNADVRNPRALNDRDNMYAFAFLFAWCSWLVSVSNLRLPATTLSNHCYCYMFRNCRMSSLPSNMLPATTLADSCYAGMFERCSITSISSDLLPATTLADSCYAYMFQETSLAYLPSDLLPVTDLRRGCYAGMFEGCALLTSLPGDLLPATELADSCYWEMFSGCGLTAVPNGFLPATTLAEYCYYSMFAYCQGIAAVPNGLLPAVSLQKDCYGYMFSGCSQLTCAPLLPATTLVSECYTGMFSNCSALKRIEVRFSSWAPAGVTEATDDWCYSVPTTSDGLFVCPSELPLTRGVDNCPTNWMAGPLWQLCFTAQESNVEIGMTRVSGPTDVSLEYSTDGVNWYDFVKNNTATPVTLANSGDRMFVRCGESGNVRISSDSDKYWCFTSTGKFSAGGNIMSLLSRDWNRKNLIPSGSSASSSEGCFARLFSYCSKLTSIMELSLPATGLAPRCYLAMFADAFHEGGGLASIPPGLLPAVDHTNAAGAYLSMFASAWVGNIDGLRILFDTIPGYGCENMFYATKIQNVPEDLIKANHIGTYGCEYMFRSSSIKNIPLLPATDLGTYAYSGMFMDCVGLQHAQTVSGRRVDLPATDLKALCYHQMFIRCDHLADTPTMSGAMSSNVSLGAGCCYGMFARCSALASTDIVFRATTAALESLCGLFEHCTSLTSVPEDMIRSIESVDRYSFRNMFAVCTSLEHAPHVSAPPVAGTSTSQYEYDGSHAFMFMSCTSLESISVGFDAWSGDGGEHDGTYNWVQNVTLNDSARTFTCPSALISGGDVARGNSRCPAGWAVSAA